jgi:hypothetical protein
MHIPPETPPPSLADQIQQRTITEAFLEDNVDRIDGAKDGTKDGVATMDEFRAAIAADPDLYAAYLAALELGENTNFAPELPDPRDDTKEANQRAQLAAQLRKPDEAERAAEAARIAAQGAPDDPITQAHLAAAEATAVAARATDEARNNPDNLDLQVAAAAARAEAELKQTEVSILEEDTANARKAALYTCSASEKAARLVQGQQQPLSDATQAALAAARAAAQSAYAQVGETYLDPSSAGLAQSASIIDTNTGGEGVGDGVLWTGNIETAAAGGADLGLDANTEAWCKAVMDAKSLPAEEQSEALAELGLTPVEGIVGEWMIKSADLPHAVAHWANQNAVH